MATYDLTNKATAFGKPTQIATIRGHDSTHLMKKVETFIDIGKMRSNGYTFASGDVLQALKIPAGTFVLAAGAEVHTAFDGTSPAADIDFDGGDDIVDGGSLSAVGYLAGGTNGQGVVVGGGVASTFTQFLTAEDTIDVTLTGTNVTTGVLRVFAVTINLDEQGGLVPTEVSRDQLA